MLIEVCDFLFIADWFNVSKTVSKVSLNSTEEPICPLRFPGGVNTGCRGVRGGVTARGPACSRAYFENIYASSKSNCRQQYELQRSRKSGGRIGLPPYSYATWWITSDVPDGAASTSGSILLFPVR